MTSAPHRICTACGLPNDLSAENCSICGFDLAEAPVASVPKPRSAAVLAGVGAAAPGGTETADVPDPDTIVDETSAPDAEPSMKAGAPPILVARSPDPAPVAADRRPDPEAGGNAGRSNQPPSSGRASGRRIPRSVLIWVCAVVLAGGAVAGVFIARGTGRRNASSASGPNASAVGQAPPASAKSRAGTAGSAPAGSGGGSGSSAGARQATLGHSLTLQGNGGESLAVTAEKVIDPLPVGSADQADPGQRYVGVQITLRNVGSAPYSDSPSNGATLISNANEQAQSTIVSGGPCGNDFQSSVKLAPGTTQQGCVPFQLSDGQIAKTFQFTLDSGFANQTGQWTLPAVASNSSAASSSATPSSSSSPSPDSSSSTSSGAADSSGGTGDPLSTLNSYWHSIQTGDYTSAYSDLAPGAINLTQDQFVSQEQQYGIQNISFSGHVSSSDGSAATVDVDSLTTNDTQYGCRNWSGSYSLTNQNGQWLIEQAKITPSPC